jgi:hypothetical protein
VVVQLTQPGGGIARPLLPIAAFEFGNTAASFLILRETIQLHHGGRSIAAATSVAVLLYAGHNLCGSGFAYVAGVWIDRANAARIAFAVAGAVYALEYLVFASGAETSPLLLLGFVLAGTGIGLAETTESTLFARLVPVQLRGSGFGVPGGVQAFGHVASSIVVGVLWTVASSSVAFLYAAGLVAASSLLAFRRTIG